MVAVTSIYARFDSRCISWHSGIQLCHEKYQLSDPGRVSSAYRMRLIASHPLCNNCIWSNLTVSCCLVLYYVTSSIIIM